VSPLSFINCCNKKQASNREEIEKRINLLENELKTFYEKKTEGAMIRAKAKWLKDAEKNTKYFFNLEKTKLYK
jgi:mannose/fructose/N-acetylgalactosamine-specific phosphotransferase system component IIB